MLVFITGILTHYTVVRVGSLFRKAVGASLEWGLRRVAIGPSFGSVPGGGGRAERHLGPLSLDLRNFSDQIDYRKSSVTVVRLVWVMADAGRDNFRILAAGSSDFETSFAFDAGRIAGDYEGTVPISSAATSSGGRSAISNFQSVFRERNTVNGSGRFRKTLFYLL